MSIQARIVSRKIIVMMIYEQLVQQQASTQHVDYTLLFDDTSLAMNRMVYMAERFFTQGEKNSEQIHDMIDVSFIKDIFINWSTTVQQVIAAVEHHATTFTFAKMDPMDKAIFLEWGVEYSVHHTPLKILINEMIEISKRYGDEWSPKLINGIGHKVIEELTI